MSPLFSTANEPYTLYHGTGGLHCLWHAVCLQKSCSSSLYASATFFNCQLLLFADGAERAQTLPAASMLMPQLLCHHHMQCYDAF